MQRGLMDKAPDFESGDCRFESCHAQLFFYNFKEIISFISRKRERDLYYILYSKERERES